MQINGQRGRAELQMEMMRVSLLTLGRRHLLQLERVQEMEKVMQNQTRPKDLSHLAAQTVEAKVLLLSLLHHTGALTSQKQWEKEEERLSMSPRLGRKNLEV
eukprot:12053037-Karenia_brevis.AAC.1